MKEWIHSSIPVWCISSPKINVFIFCLLLFCRKSWLTTIVIVTIQIPKPRPTPHQWQGNVQCDQELLYILPFSCLLIPIPAAFIFIQNSALNFLILISVLTQRLKIIFKKSHFTTFRVSLTKRALNKVCSHVSVRSCKRALKKACAQVSVRSSKRALK